jgi:CubicO group peptidase (beta-lactamase class C family)
VLASRIAGQSLENVMRDRLFGPLGMHSIGFHAADISKLTTAYDQRDGQFVVSDPPDGHWSRPPAFHDGGAGMISSVDDVVAFGRLLARSGQPVLKSATVARMTSNQLTAEQRANEWPGFDLLDGQGWGFGVSVLDDGRYGWEGGLGTSGFNVPSQDLTVVVLTQRAASETGMPAVCEEVLAIAI